MYVTEYKDTQTRQWVSFERTGTITSFSQLTLGFDEDPPPQKDKWGQHLYQTGDKKGTLLLSTPSLQCISLALRQEKN